MNKPKKIALLLALTLLFSLLAACGSTGGTQETESGAAEATQTPESSGGGTATTSPSENVTNVTETKDSVNIGIAQDLDDRLDPHYAVAAGTKEILFNIFEGLVKPSPEGELIPAVAETVETAPDGLSYTFTLRPGVKFHNGQDVTMDDVVYSLRRNYESADGEPLVPALAVISDLTYDDTTLTVHLSEPLGELLAYLTLAIIPADYTEQDTAPVGTGPYRFVSRTAQDSVVLEKFDGYWGTPANIEHVTLRIIENVEGLVLGLQSGALDLVAHLSSTQTSQLNERDFHIAEGSMNLVQALYLNNAEPPFDDVRVRQALCYAIDKQAVIDLAFDGYGTPLGTSMFPSFAKYYDDTLTDYYPTDIAQAKALLTEAGFPNGFDMTITVPSNYQPHVDAATVIAELLREVNINVTILPVEWSAWLSDVYGARQFQSTITGLTSDNMTARKLLDRFQSGASNNFTNYNNSEYDELGALAFSSFDDAEQTALYRQMERNLTENAANVYLQDMADLVAMRNGLDGLTFYPLYVLDIAALRWS